MIEIDGSHNEGGGQILRTALALSTITNKPFKITNIRKNRPQPGLKNQHLFCIKALQQLTDAKTLNAELGADFITFTPGTIKSRTLSIDIETAGSITLLLQSLLIPCLFANGKVRLKIKGGTDVKWSMPFNYLNNVLIPHLRKFCNKIDVKLENRGYYPKGNGKLDILIQPKYRLSDYNTFNEFQKELKSKIKPINLVEQGRLLQLKGVSHASLDLQKAFVAERQAKSAKHQLSNLNIPTTIESNYFKTLSTGSGITLYAKFANKHGELDYSNPVILGSDELGERSKRAEEIGKLAADKLINEINSQASVDQYLADNLIPLLALIGGQMKTSKITNHTLTNIYTVNHFLDTKIDVDKTNNIIKTN